MPSRSSFARDLRAQRPIVVAVAATYAGWIAFGAVAGSASTLAYALMMPVLIAVATVAEHRIGFSRPLLWALTAWAFFHMAGGLVEVGGHGHVLYNADWSVPVLRFDRLVHAFGFGAATVACWQALTPRLGATPDTREGVIAALAGMGIGALNEVVEFAASRLASTNVGGYSNTGFDLAFNTIGCALAAAWLVRRPRSAGSVQRTEGAERSTQAGMNPSLFDPPRGS